MCGASIVPGFLKYKRKSSRGGYTGSTKILSLQSNSHTSWRESLRFQGNPNQMGERDNHLQKQFNVTKIKKAILQTKDLRAVDLSVN